METPGSLAKKPPGHESGGMINSGRGGGSWAAPSRAKKGRKKAGVLAAKESLPACADSACLYGREAFSGPSQWVMFGAALIRCQWLVPVAPWGALPGFLQGCLRSR